MQGGYRREGSSGSSTSVRGTSPLPQGTICTATSDLESLVVVPLSHLSSVEAVKDVIMSRLHIADEDMPRHAFYLTTIGRGEGRPVGDDELWSALARSAAGEGPQITVFAKEVVPASQSGFSGADFAGGMSAERMRQVQQAREREQRRERDREASARSPTSDSYRRDREPSSSSRSDVSSGHRGPHSRVGEVDEIGRKAGSLSERPGGTGLRSDRPQWATGGAGAHSRSHGSRGLSASEGASSSGTRIQSSAGQLSPSMGRHGSGLRREGSTTPTTSPEDYFHASPALSTSAFASPPLSSSSASAYHPHLPTSPPPLGGSSQVVHGPSGPTRFLPPQPQDQHQQQYPSDPRQRGYTAPAIQVTAPSWASSIPAPQHSSSVPVARPIVSPFAPSSRPLPPSDPRSALPQYSSQPYKNLPLPGASSPYHNLSLQAGQYNSVVHPAPQPPPSLRPGSLAPAQPPRMGSKSADNLRSSFASSPQPPQPPPLPQEYHTSGAVGSRSPQPLVPAALHPVTNPFVSPPPPSAPTPASAFYSAPVQAQHQTAARAAPYPPYSSSPREPYPHSQSQPYVPHQPRRPTLEQSSTLQPNVIGSGPSGAIPRPSTMYDLATGGFDVRPGETLQQGKTRRASALAGGEGRKEGSASFEGQSPSPTQRDAVTSPVSSSSSQHASPPLARSPPTSASASPMHSAPAFKDDDGLYDGIAEPDRRPLPANTSSSVSPPTSARSSTHGPLTPATSSPARIPAPAAPKPLVLDEFGDPIDEETSTWFPVGQPLPLTVPPMSKGAAEKPQEAETRAEKPGPKLDEFGDPVDEETSTWFPVGQPASSPATAAVAAAAPPPPSAPSDPQLDEFGDPIDEETGTWFPVGQPSPGPPKPPGPTPLQQQQVGTTTHVPAPSSYGSSSPMRRQHSAPTSSAAGSASGTGAGGSGSGGGGSAGTVHDRKASVPTAQDWQSTILSRFGASNVEEGTIGPGGAAGTLRPAPQRPKPKLVDDFGDDLEDEGATFFAGHGPAAAPTPQAQIMKRPSLRLKIDAPTPPGSAHPTAAPNGHGESSSSTVNRRSASSDHDSSPLAPLPNISAHRAEATGRRGFSGTPRLDDLVRLDSRPNPGAGTGGIASPFARRNSFAARAQDEKDWAFRPPVETVLEHLDVFFPEHDLDKPVFDLPTPGPSTPSSNASGSSPVRDVAAPSSVFATRRTGGGSSGPGLGYKKSIRVVALDRKRQLQKAGRNVASAASGLASNLLRRRSTKLFGARIEEVTSAQMKQINAIKETSAEDPDNFSYKWIKGDLIGRGTYGHVYIALSVTTGETIAVKQVEMPRTFSDKEDQRVQGMINSLKAEIELLKDLDHPNIVLYLGMEQTPEFLSIFLEYVPGGSIGRIIRTHGKFEENVIKFFTHQILDGLEYLHSLGILHRDMKADNILIDQDGMCKISDFGTSKKSGDIYQNNENMSMQGSIFWMAPEVIHNNKQGYSAKADIWSLGCICIEMLAGSRPWEGEGFMGAMFKLGAERMRPPLPPDVQLSDFADQFVSDCLQIEPANRPKASEAKNHPFLAIEPGWSFAQTALYRIMTAEEDRRRTPHTPSAPTS
ncbi:mitogen-activated protein kinase kinase kinase [Rhodosporidiobolus nylandii]